MEGAALRVARSESKPKARGGARSALLPQNKINELVLLKRFEARPAQRELHGSRKHKHTALQRLLYNSRNAGAVEMKLPSLSKCQSFQSRTNWTRPRIFMQISSAPPPPRPGSGRSSGAGSARSGVTEKWVTDGGGEGGWGGGGGKEKRRRAKSLLCRYSQGRSQSTQSAHGSALGLIVLDTPITHSISLQDLWSARQAPPQIRKYPVPPLPYFLCGFPSLSLRCSAALARQCPSRRHGAGTDPQRMCKASASPVPSAIAPPTRSATRRQQSFISEHVGSKQGPRTAFPKAPPVISGDASLLKVF